MAYADSTNALPTWPAPNTLYIAPESQGVAVGAGTLTQRRESGTSEAGNSRGVPRRPAEIAALEPAPEREAAPGQEGREGEGGVEPSPPPRAPPMLPPPPAASPPLAPPAPPPSGAEALPAGDPSEQDRVLEQLLARGRQLKEAMSLAMEGSSQTRPPPETPVTPSDDADDLAPVRGVGPLPLDYHRMEESVLRPIWDAAEHESDSEDDLVRSLLHGGDKRGFEVKSKYPTLAAAEKARLDALERVRFLTLGLPSLTLLNVHKPPKACMVRYTLPPHAMAPPVGCGVTPGGGKMACALVTADGRERRGRQHPGVYVPDPRSNNNPLCAGVEMSDLVLNAWIDRAVVFELSALRSSLLPERRLKAGEVDEEVVVGVAELPLRDVILSPYLSIATALELQRTQHTPTTWKTREGPGGEAFIGFVNVECSLTPGGLPQVNAAPYGRDLTATSRSVVPGAQSQGPAQSHGVSAASQPTLVDGGAAAAGASTAPAEDSEAEVPLRLYLHVGRAVGVQPEAGRGRIKSLRLKYWELSTALSQPRARAMHEIFAPSRSSNRRAQAQPTFDFNHDTSTSTLVSPALLDRMCRGHQVFELWARTVAELAASSSASGSSPPPSGESLLGLVKVPLTPLTQDFAAHRSQDEVLPLMAADGPRDVLNPFSGRRCGSLDLCLALGTDAQVENLRVLRARVTALQARARGFLARRRSRARSLRLDKLVREQQQQQQQAAGQQQRRREDGRRPVAGGDAGGGPGREREAGTASDLPFQREPAERPPRPEQGEADGEGARRARDDGSSPLPPEEPHPLEMSDDSLLDSTSQASSAGSEWRGLLKHSVEVTIQGPCPLGEAAQGADGGDGPSCYVRYFIKKCPQSTVVNQASLPRHDQMLESRGPFKGAGSALEQAVCLWWDPDASCLNSRAKHVIMAPAGDAIDALLCPDHHDDDDGDDDGTCEHRDPGLHFQVWLLDNAASPRQRLVGTAFLPRERLNRLLRIEVACQVYRLEVARQEGEATAPDHINLSLAYSREPQVVARARQQQQQQQQGRRGSQSREGQGQGRRMLYGESTIVDRLLPARGSVCVSVSGVTGVQPDVRALVQRLFPRQPAGAGWTLALEYDIFTGRRPERLEGGLLHGDGVCRRHVVGAGGLEALRFLDELPIAINSDFVEYLHSDRLRLRLVAVPDEAPEDEGVVLARAAAPLQDLLSSMSGVGGTFPWAWEADDDQPAAEAGAVRLAVYFKHRQRYTAPPEAPPPEEPPHDTGRPGPHEPLPRGEEDRPPAPSGPSPPGRGWEDEPPSERPEGRGPSVHPRGGSEAPADGGLGGSSKVMSSLLETPPGSGVREVHPSDAVVATASPPHDPDVGASAWYRSPGRGQGSEAPSVGALSVVIEEARHLELPDTCLAVDGASASSLFVSYEWEKEVLTTEPVAASPAPVWDHASSPLRLPSAGCLREVPLVLQLWERPSYLLYGGEHVRLAELGVAALRGMRFGDVVLGRSVVDLSPLALGMAELCGWYHLVDGRGEIRGQIKVRVQANPPITRHFPPSPAPRWTLEDGEPPATTPAVLGLGFSPGDHASADNLTLRDVVSRIDLESMRLRDAVMQLDTDLAGSGPGSGGGFRTPGSSPGKRANIPALEPGSPLLRSAFASPGRTLDSPTSPSRAGLAVLRELRQRLESLDEDLLAHFTPEYDDPRYRQSGTHGSHARVAEPKPEQEPEPGPAPSGSPAPLPALSGEGPPEEEEEEDGYRGLGLELRDLPCLSLGLGLGLEGVEPSPPGTALGSPQPMEAVSPPAPGVGETGLTFRGAVEAAGLDSEASLCELPAFPTIAPAEAPAVALSLGLGVHEEEGGAGGVGTAQASPPHAAPAPEPPQSPHQPQHPPEVLGQTPGVGHDTTSREDAIAPRPSEPAPILAASPLAADSPRPGEEVGAPPPSSSSTSAPPPEGVHTPPPVPRREVGIQTEGETPPASPSSGLANPSPPPSPPPPPIMAYQSFESLGLLSMDDLGGGGRDFSDSQSESSDGGMSLEDMEADAAASLVTPPMPPLPAEIPSPGGVAPASPDLRHLSEVPSPDRGTSVLEESDSTDLGPRGSLSGSEGGGLRGAECCTETSAHEEEGEEKGRAEAPTPPPVTSPVRPLDEDPRGAEEEDAAESPPVSRERDGWGRPPLPQRPALGEESSMSEDAASPRDPWTGGPGRGESGEARRELERARSRRVRFADSETERIARIMMGKLQTWQRTVSEEAFAAGFQGKPYPGPSSKPS
jgi:hypothetical protein